MKQPKNYLKNWRAYLKISLLSLLIIIAGCAASEPRPITKVEQLPVISPPKAESMNMLDVQIMVLNKQELEEFLSEMSEDTAIFALTPKNYENLALNMQEIKRFILQQQEIVLYYEGIFKKEVTDEQ